MIDIDLRFRMIRRSVARKARGPRTGMRSLLLLVGVVVVLSVGSGLLGVTPQSLLDAIT